MKAMIRVVIYFLGFMVGMLLEGYFNCTEPLLFFMTGFITAFIGGLFLM